MKKLLGIAIAAVCVLPALAALSSGLDINAPVPSVHPYHVAGPDKDSMACPPCKYGSRPAVQAWFNNEDPKVAGDIIDLLGKSVNANKAKEFKGFALFLTDKDPSECTEADAIKAGYCKSCTEGNCHCDKVGIAFLAKDNKGVQSYKYNLDSSVKNTVIVYKERKVIAKFVNLTSKDLPKLKAEIDKIVK